MSGNGWSGDGGALPPELDPRGRRPATSGHESPARDTRRGAVLGVKTVVALLSVAILVLSGYYWVTYNRFNSGLNRLDVLGGANGPDIDGADQNILIAGNDDRQSATDAELAELSTSRDGGSLNTDTMMVVHIPADGAKASVISFPRDSYVAIPGFGSNKLNSAYPDGYNASAASGSVDDKRAAGARLLIQAIQNLSGLTIDHFVQVDLLGFYRISNAVGGVPVVLCAAQKEPMSGIDLPAGRSVIEGKQALAFVRQRYGLPNGDLDRIKRQQYFLSAAFRQLTSGSTLLLRLNSVLSAVSRSLQVDKTLNILDLAKQLQGLTADNISFATIPTDGFADNDAGSVVVVRPAEVKAFVLTVVRATGTTTTSSSAPAAGSVTVDVLNGGGTNGAAQASADILKKYGFVIGRVATADSSSDVTLVEYPAGQQAQAADVAAHVPGATLRQATVAHVTVLLGGDGHSAQVAAARKLGAAAGVPVASRAALAPDTTGCVD